MINKGRGYGGVGQMFPPKQQNRIGKLFSMEIAVVSARFQNWVDQLNADVRSPTVSVLGNLCVRKWA